MRAVVYDGKHEPVLSKQLFDKVQKVMDVRAPCSNEGDSQALYPSHSMREMRNVHHLRKHRKASCTIDAHDSHELLSVPPVHPIRGPRDGVIHNS